MTQTTQPTLEHPEWVLMAKALRGELSVQEQLQFSDWLNADESHAQLWADAIDTWAQVGAAQPQSYVPDTQLAWEKLCATVNLEPLSTRQEPVLGERQAISSFAWNQVLRYAAILLMVAGLSWVGYLQLNPSPDWAQVTTRSGERKMVYLPDGSLVTLNGNSMLHYQTAFESAERKVELVGEAFFDVQKKPTQPFVITTGQAKTTVLGTSFNVKALKDAAEVTVTVVTGKVSLASLKNSKEIILTPGLTGSLTSTDQLVAVKTLPSKATSWRTLAFQATSLQDVALQLEQFFGASITVSSPDLQQCSFTGTFENPDLTEILRVLAASNDVIIKQSKPNKYVISGPGCR